ncbi:MAG: hypothetical protein IKU38_08915 [Clostridia bacterium]|nr:hypothetical protein [Clostridia bacterium]
MPKETYPITDAYHALVSEKGGALPTSREVADRSGASVSYARKALERKSLPYNKQTGNQAAAKAVSHKREQRDIINRQIFEDLIRQLGRPPTRSEMNEAAGRKKNDTWGSDVARRLGLVYTDPRRSEGKAAMAGKKLRPDGEEYGKASQEYDFGHQASPSMRRIMEIRESTGMGEGKGWGHSPSEGYEVKDRKMTTCPVCGTRKLIAPRMHPFWLRDKQGKVIFVCSRGCTGQAMT